jgi:hypothetical protein
MRNSRAEKYLLLRGIVATVACNEKDPCEPFNDKVNLGGNRGDGKVKMQHKGSLSYDLGK